jgi:micrococcal nuclease
MKTRLRRAGTILAIILLGLASRYVSEPPGRVRTVTNKEAQITSVATSSAFAAVTAEFETAAVKRVIDGDTIELTDGRRVRYIGINTPETVDPRRTVECFGREASVKNKQLVEGKTVKLEKDISENDTFGRILRYVYVTDVFINDYLVRQGYARASTYPPDVKYADRFVASEREARLSARGLWNACGDSVH